LIAFKFEGIASLRQRHAGAAVCGQCGRLAFEGQSNVAAFATSGLERKDYGLECIKGDPGFFIFQVLTSELGKSCLYPRRLTVFNGLILHL
jgi:hypothetical protein